jgi:hypothetical protein
MLGTCCATVMAEGTTPIACFYNLMQFYRHESCSRVITAAVVGASATPDPLVDVLYAQTDRPH